MTSRAQYLKGYCHRHAHYRARSADLRSRVDFWAQKNERVIILNGHNPNRAADVETPIYMHSGWKYIDVAENKESLEPEDRRQWPRAGSVELSPTGTEWNARGFAYSNSDRNVYLWSCATPHVNIAVWVRELEWLAMPRERSTALPPLWLMHWCRPREEPEYMQQRYVNRLIRLKFSTVHVTASWVVYRFCL